VSNILPIHSKDGHTYWVEEGDTLYIQRLQAGQYQRNNGVFAQTLIDTWTRAIDVGTNNACNAIHYAKRFATVECFEPTPLAQQLWENTVRDNQVSNVTLYPVGVGEKSYTTEIITHWKNGGHNHLTHYDKNPRADENRGHRVRVPVQVETLDSFNFQDVGFIKVDVEGYEKFVLEGAQQLVSQCRPTIQLEIVGNQCRKFNYKGEDMIDWIRSWDYTVISRHRGPLRGNFHTEKADLLYNGEKHKGEMDLWFQPNERMRVYQFEQLFKEQNELHLPQ
jgi:FkbM family methyltransferase